MPRPRRPQAQAAQSRMQASLRFYPYQPSSILVAPILLYSRFPGPRLDRPPSDRPLSPVWFQGGVLNATDDRRSGACADDVNAQQQKARGHHGRHDQPQYDALAELVPVRGIDHRHLPAALTKPAMSDRMPDHHV